MIKNITTLAIFISIKFIAFSQCADSLIAPNFTNTIGGWDESGMEFTADVDCKLTTVVFENQGNADTIKLYNSNDSMLYKQFVPANNLTYTFNPNWPLTQGETYTLASKGPSNGRWEGYTSYPVVNNHTTLLGVRDVNQQTSHTDWWFHFSKIKTTTSTSDSIATTSCDSFVSPSGNYVWTTNGTYLDTLVSVCGGDSLLTINLTINNSTGDSITEIACDSFVSPSGNYIWTSSGFFTDTLINSVSCDSVITVDLTINTVDATVTNNDPMLIANANGATYQWLDCDNNFAIISGETNQNFSPSGNGNYAVEVSQNGCTDTSVCEQVSTVGINNVIYANDVKIFPNPAGNTVIVEINSKQAEFNYTVFDLAGKAVLEGILDNPQNRVNIGLLEKGMYLIKIQENYFRLIKN